MKRIILLFVLSLASLAISAREIEGPYLILSTPYHDDGSVDYESLVNSARFRQDQIGTFYFSR